MCIICIDLIRGKINYKDALNNMVERLEEIDEKHMERILNLVSEKQKEEKEADDEEAPIFP